MPDKPYTVIQATKRVIIDAAGNPVPGYHVDFLTTSGMRGFVDIPADQFNADAGRQALTAEAQRLEAILKL